MGARPHWRRLGALALVVIGLGIGILRLAPARPAVGVNAPSPASPTLRVVAEVLRPPGGRQAVGGSPRSQSEQSESGRPTISIGRTHSCPSPSFREPRPRTANREDRELAANLPRAARSSEALRPRESAASRRISIAANRSRSQTSRRGSGCTIVSGPRSPRPRADTAGACCRPSRATTTTTASCRCGSPTSAV